jgi:phosphohistidine phosphatase
MGGVYRRGIMNRLIVVRHAKATHKPGFADADRPLTSRGRRNAEAAGEWLLSEKLIPELVLCSASCRTRQTWDQLALALAAGRDIEVDYDPRLYDAGDDGVLDVIGATPGDVRTLMIVGHNPAMQDIAAGLTGQGDLGFPTTAIAVIDLGSWARLVPGSGSLHAFWTPGLAAP